MKKKLVAFSVVFVLVAVAIGGATLAYFTDTESKENVFTVGNVDITLIESYVHRSASTSYEKNVATGYPDQASGTHTDDQILAGSDYNGSTVYDDYLDSVQIMPGVEANKMPYVMNEGTAPAYIRIRVMSPVALGNNVSASVCATAYLGTTYTRENGVLVPGDDREFDFDVAQFTTPGRKTVDGVEYNVYEFYRREPLAAGEMTTWNVWNTIGLEARTTTTELENYIASGAITADGKFNVVIEADAIQAASFADYQAAFAAFDAQSDVAGD